MAASLPPVLKRASPHDVKKAFGVHAQRALEVIDSHADCLEGLIVHVQALTKIIQAQDAKIEALMDGYNALVKKETPDGA